MFIAALLASCAQPDGDIIGTMPGETGAPREPAANATLDVVPFNVKVIGPCGMTNTPELEAARNENSMKHHLVTVLLIIAALPLYAAGFAGGGTVALGLAIILEAWFWIRIVRGRRKTG